MPDAVDAITATIIVFIVALIGIAVFAGLPAVEGTFSDEARRFRLTMAEILVVAATTLGGVTVFVIAKLGSMR